MTTPTKVRAPRRWPDRLAGVGLFAVCALVLGLTYGQFRGDFTTKTHLTMLSSRAGLVMAPGSKVTYNGVSIGRVADIAEVEHNGEPAAKLALDVDPAYLRLIPRNVDAKILATTVFGNKYVSFTTPKNPSAQSVTPEHVIDATTVTTEFNTLFQTITEISEKVDPVKLNLTLSAAAQALSGLGDKFGASIVKGNAILDDLNPQMPMIRHDVRQIAALGETYTSAAPDLFDFLDNLATTAHTLTAQQGQLDQALLAATGFGNTGEDIFQRSKQFLERTLADLLPTAQLLDAYSPEFLCTVRNLGNLANTLAVTEGGNRYAAQITMPIIGTENPYVYPDNLPRTNARGGPGGAPGCWQPITHDLWPAPYLVMDTGNSIAPYTHFEIAQPLVNEYVWGRQFGEYSINP